MPFATSSDGTHGCDANKRPRERGGYALLKRSEAGT